MLNYNMERSEYTTSFKDLHVARRREASVMCGTIRTLSRFVRRKGNESHLLSVN